MQKLIIGLTGVIENMDLQRIGSMGSGKDTVADFLVAKYKACKIAMADPLKRVCRDVYRFTDDQLWGPSTMRNTPDIRYPRNEHVWVPLNIAGGTIIRCDCCGAPGLRGRSGPDDKDPCHLTPRYALRLLGTEWGRHCYADTWTSLALYCADKVLNEGWGYTQRFGLDADDPRSAPFRPEYDYVVIPDVRFKNEIDFIKKGGGKVIRIVRPVETIGGVDLHPSESEALAIPDSEFDHIILNDQGLQYLEARVDAMMASFIVR
jgi:hypothetical protein